MTRAGILAVLTLLGAQSVAQRQSTKPAAEPHATPSLESPREKAWSLLSEGLKDKNADKRAKAARALGLLTGNTEAEKAAANALRDEKANVRQAAAHALARCAQKMQRAISKRPWGIPSQVWCWQQRIRCCCFRTT